MCLIILYQKLYQVFYKFIHRLVDLRLCTMGRKLRIFVEYGIDNYIVFGVLYFIYSISSREYLDFYIQSRVTW